MSRDVAVLLEQCLAPVPGGTGRYSREIAAALARTAPAGARVLGVVGAHRDVGPARVPGVLGPRRLPVPGRLLSRTWERRWPPRVPGGCVHAPTPLAPAARPGQRLVVTVHDAVPWSHPHTLTPRGVAWHRQAVALAARHADAVVVPTHAVAAELAGIMPALAGRLHVVGEGVSGDLALPAAADVDATVARLGLPDGGFLLSLATLEPRKGLDLLLQALGIPGAPPLPLLVAGQPGWGRLDLPAEAARAGLPPGRVRLLGRVPDTDLAVLLHRATALVVPSRAEGFGLPLLEGMAAGTPVIVSDAPALVEVAGGAAVVVPREDVAALARALASVAGDPAARAAQSAAGRARAAAFTWDGAARRLWQLYDGLG